MAISLHGLFQQSDPSWKQLQNGFIYVLTVREPLQHMKKLRTAKRREKQMFKAAMTKGMDAAKEKMTAHMYSGCHRIRISADRVITDTRPGFPEHRSMLLHW